MSGSVTGQYEVPPHQIDLAKREARVLGCTDESIKPMMDCLKTVRIVPTVYKHSKISVFLLHTDTCPRIW